MALAAAEAELTKSRDRSDAAERVVAELEARPPVPSATEFDFKVLQSNVLTHVSIMSSDIVRLRRLIEARRGDGVAHAEFLHDTYLDLLESPLTCRPYPDPTINLCPKRVS